MARLPPELDPEWDEQGLTESFVAPPKPDWSMDTMTVPDQCPACGKVHSSVDERVRCLEGGWQ